MTGAAPHSTRSLAGRCLVVTRSEDQSAGFADALRALGADVRLAPAIRSTPPPDPDALARCAASLDGARWLGFTSPSGVRFGADALRVAWPGGLPDGLGLAVVGPGTAEALLEAGWAADFVPSTSTGDAFADEVPVSPGDRVVLMRSDIARRAIAERLIARGALVDDAVAYRTVEGADPTHVAGVLAAMPDAVTFTSPSCVRGFLSALPDGYALPADTLLAAIGPVTAQEIQASGYAVGLVADPPHIAGLTTALVRHFT